MAYGLSNTTSSDLTNKIPFYTVTPVTPNLATGQNETIYQNTKWSTQYGTFLKCANLQAAINMQSTWTVGKGYYCDAETKVILEHISGFGKDSFLSIMHGLNSVCHLAGDSYAEIIMNEDKTVILNLKPIDPGTMKIIFDEKGLVKRYEQTNNTNKNELKTFEPQEIFHLSNKKIGASLNGVSDLEALQDLIDADKESFIDLRTIMHRQSRPMLLFKLGTDDTTKINKFKTETDTALSKNENLYVPFDDKTLSVEPVQINLSPALFQYREMLKAEFFRALGLPLSLFGSAGGTESGSKIEYLAHETVFSKNALFLEEQIWNQLYLKVKFISPATLLDNLQTDQSKDGQQGMEIQQGDVTAGGGA
jgi:hypothetical protein